ncbi:MAG: hypothetical protein OIF57_13945 [Marinobacterium sp.]|nr:hypothetical protein [Marinobacterium sp.]
MSVMNECNVFAESYSGEIWDCESPEEAIGKIVDNCAPSEILVGDVIFIEAGKKRQVKASDYAPNLAEYLQERAFEETYEDVAENWLSDEAGNAELQKAFCTWLDDYLTRTNDQPDFYDITCSQPMACRITALTDDDFEWVEEPYSRVLNLLHDIAAGPNKVRNWVVVEGWVSRVAEAGINLGKLERLIKAMPTLAYDALYLRLSGDEDRTLNKQFLNELLKDQHEFIPLIEFLHQVVFGELSELFYGEDKSNDTLNEKQAQLDLAKATALDWCNKNPEWVPFSAIKDDIDRYFVTWDDLSPLEKMLWESEQKWREYAVRKCRVERGFISSEGRFYSHLSHVPSGYASESVFKTGGANV